jgi:hypothetical protein
MSVGLFDDPGLDHALARGLSELAPEVDAVDLTLAELRPRFHRARTRRRVVRASAAMTALLVVGSAAAAAAPSARHSHVMVESPDRRLEPSTVPHRRPKHPSTSVPQRPAVTKPRAAPATNAPPASSAPNTSGASAPLVVTVPPTSATPASTRATAPATTPQVPQPLRYSSEGGTITVRFAKGRMTLVGVYPAKGYHVSRRVVTPSRIDVGFARRSRGGASEIELNVVNGRVVQSNGDHESWTSRGISAVSPFARPAPPGHRLASRPPHAGPGPHPGHGPARLLAFRTVLSKRVSKVQLTHVLTQASGSGKHGAPRHLVRVDE